MKEITIHNSRGGTLAGTLYEKNPEKIVILCHGFRMDRHEGGRLDIAAKSLDDAGFSVFQLDFSGSGLSSDDSLTVEKEVDDLQCVLRHFKSSGYKKIGLLGVSLGGLVSLRCAGLGISTMVLWAPVSNSKSREKELSRYTEEQLKELQDTGKITVIREGAVREKVVVDGQMVEDRANVNQEKLAQGIVFPVLFIHGDQDERVPLDDSKRIVELSDGEAELYIPKGEGHVFKEKLGEIVERTTSWFVKYL